MKNSTLRKIQSDIKPLACPPSFNWADNPDVQRLLDVVSEIIANEYIETAKKNKDVFEVASSRPCPISEGKAAPRDNMVGGKE